MFTAITTQPGRSFRSRFTTGLPTPVPSSDLRHRPARSGHRVTWTTRRITSVYGVPSAIRSRYRSCSDTTFFKANFTASQSPVVSARSTTAITVKSLLCPKSTPTKYQSIAPIFPPLLPSSASISFHLVGQASACQSELVGHALACQSELVGHALACQSELVGHALACQSELVGHALACQSEQSSDATPLPI